MASTAPSSPIGTTATLLIGGIGALFVMANQLIPTLSPAVQPWGQVAVYAGAIAWLLALLLTIISGQNFAIFVYGGEEPAADAQPASVVVFILVACGFFAAANGAIPTLAIYEDATQAMAQLFTFGCGTLSVAYVVYSIMANQDFSHLIFGGVRTRAEEKDMKAERGEEVSEDEEEDELEEEEEEEEDDDDEEEDEEEEGVKAPTSKKND